MQCLNEHLASGATLPAGSKGYIVEIHGEGDDYEVDFYKEDGHYEVGHYTALLALGPEDIESDE